MKKYLLVDAYNIIHGWDNLQELSKVSLEYARDHLIEILADYQGYTNQHIIIVFDAHKQKGNPEQVIPYNKYVTIIYTKEAETADQYIEKTTHKINKNNRVRVATSDGLEQIIILGHGATRISARELKKEVEQVRKKGKKHFNKDIPIKTNPLEIWMSPDVIATIEHLRRQK